jgi:hypothetical protein
MTTRVTLLATLLTLGVVVVPAPGSAQGAVDGEITPGEYELSVSLGDGHFKLYWEIEGETIKMAMEAEASGMVAIGIEPTRRMKHADMVIGFRVDSGGFEVHDAWSVDETGPHPDDTVEGGTFDLLEYTAKESGGITVIEFTRSLDTGDRYDKATSPTGKVKFIWATSDDDDFSAYHGRRGTAIIDMESGEVEAVEYPTLWPIHAILMTVGTGLLLAAFFCIVYKKKLKKKYINIHHNLAQGGAFIIITGLVVGFVMVGRLDSGHFRVGHSFIGGTTIVLMFGALGLGSVWLMYKSRKRQVRKPHMYVGGTAILLMVAAVMAGLAYVFP